ncbi:MAG: S-layer homology domain-containing protein, partial [Gemmatimonadetes bacterium]|nr:S-layer homology domain-containing protein [Gemmatimonadota bacterium]
MPQPVTKRRSGTSILAAGALVASLVAVGARPAGAVETVADHATPVTACIGDATEDWMFDDVSQGHYFRGAINCLAYYGVTIGYGDGTFRPSRNVSRFEMVLFMERSARAAGADPADVVQDFAATGSDPVNRADMALLIARL